MNTAIIAMVLAVLALSVSVSGAALAQTPQPPVSSTPVIGAQGPLHDYMVDAMAAALGITSSDFEACLAAGKTADQIALDLGIPAKKLAAPLSGSRAKAVDAAVADGVIMQQQADWMKTRGGGMGFCIGTGHCRGQGAGMMVDGMTGRGGWRWQTTHP